jgi:hypothetical protein
VLSKDQLINLLKKSNTTLAIMGRFSQQDGSRRYVFSNSNGRDGKISVVDLFNQLKPELCTSTTGQSVTIGETIFNSYKLTTPLKPGKDATSQPILFDSPLLNSSVYSNGEALKMQAQGKQVLQQLLGNLDTIAYFTQSEFTKSLLKIAEHYLVKEANRNLDDSHKPLIAESEQWEQTIYSDLSFCSMMVQYLTAYEQDETAIETNFKRYLKSLKNDSTDSKSDLYTNEQVEQLAKALAKCKRVMLDQSEEDPIWRELATTGSFSWLKDYASDPAYGLNSPQLAQKAGNKKFLAYYRVFIDASDEVHRLVRTQAIHPSIFCWLAGKYQKWESTTTTQAAQKMYEIGVKGQNEKRIRTESKKQLIQYWQNIKKIEIASKLQTQLNESGLIESYDRFAEIVQDQIYNVLLPSRVFTRKELSSRATNLFKVLSQLAGGKVGEIIQQNDQFNELFVTFYRTILTIDEDATREYFEKRLTAEAEKKKDKLAKFSNFQIKEFIQSVIEKATEAPGEKDLKTKVTETFVSQFAEVSKNRFAKDFLDNLDQIKEDEFRATILYELRNQQQVSSEQQEGSAGAPVYSVSDNSIPELTQKELLTEKRQKNLEKTYSAAIDNSFKSRIIPIVSESFTSLPEGTKGELIGPKGEQCGTVTVLPNQQMEVNVDDPQKGQNLTEGQIKVNREKGENPTEGQTEVNKVEEDNYNIADIPEIQALANEIVHESKKLDALQGNVGQLSERMDTILKKYTSEENKLFNKSLRSLLLCEYILAAPKGTTALDKEDTGNILGLMVDIVEHLGEKDDPKILDGVLIGDKKLQPLLEKINLSKYYPAEDFKQISTIFQYQRQLCEELNKVQEYLQELAELKSFFEIMQPTDLKIVVIDSTVAEYGDINNIDPNDFCFNVDSPSIVYLTAQSGVTSDNLKQMAETMVILIGDTANAKKLQIPIFVTAQSNLPQAVHLPLISPTNLKLPVFLPEKYDGQKNASQDLNIVTDWTEQQAINPYLLLSAAPMLLDTSSTMGIVKDFKYTVNTQVQNLYGIGLRKDSSQNIAEVLRKIWLSTNGKVRLVDTLMFTKWLNLLILDMRTDRDGKTKNIQDIKNRFGNILDTALWKPKDSDPDFNFIAISKAAFPTFAELAELPIKTSFNNSLISPEEMGGSDILITAEYGTLLPPKDLKYSFKLSWINSFATLIEDTE